MSLFKEFGRSQKDLSTGKTLRSVMLEEKGTIIPLKGEMVRSGEYGKYILIKNPENLSIFLGLSSKVEELSLVALLSKPIYAGESTNGKWVRIGAEGGEQEKGITLAEIEKMMADGALATNS
jgi:hypothetical protein